MAIPLSELNFERAVDYHYDQFPPGNLDYGRLIKPLAQATDAIARYDQMLKNMHNSEILLAPLRNQEAVISSRMEGTISTMDEILRYEADFDEDEHGATQVRSEVIETLLYQRALKAAQQSLENGRPISGGLIRAVHQRLLFFGRGAEKDPGQYKKEQNYLADKTKRNILFIPIRPEKLIDGLEGFFNYIENDEELILIKAAVSHVEFEALHPFKDGNGRIGRMLITLMLWDAGVISEPHFYVSAHLEENKDQYIDSMREVSRSGDWTGWCCFFLEALEKQAKRNLRIVEDITGLYGEMKGLFRTKLSSKWHIKALDYIFTNPVFRNNKFTKGSGIPATTAAKFSRTLVDEGLLRTLEEASGRRPALYSFEPLMDLVRV